MKLKFSLQILDNKNLNNEFNQNPSSGSRVVPSKQRDEQTDMTMVTVVFRSFSNAPKTPNKIFFNKNGVRCALCGLHCLNNTAIVTVLMGGLVKKKYTHSSCDNSDLHVSPFWTRQLLSLLCPDTIFPTNSRYDVTTCSQYGRGGNFSMWYKHMNIAAKSICSRPTRKRRHSQPPSQSTKRRTLYTNGSTHSSLGRTQNIPWYPVH